MGEVTFSPEDYEGSKYKMWEDISSLISILIKNNYVVLVRRDDFDIVVVEYDYEDEGLACKFLRWITPEENELLSNYAESEANNISEND